MATKLLTDVAASANATVTKLPGKIRFNGIPKNNIYLPKVTIGLLRTPNLPPNYAQFVVPLHFNKLDLKNYLQNAYGLKVLSVRSYVQQFGIYIAEPGEVNSAGHAFRKWRRPPPVKKMMIEMEEPFVYPDAPTDLTAWDKELYDRQDEFQKSEQFNLGDKASRNPKKEERERLMKEERRRAEEVGEKVVTVGDTEDQKLGGKKYKEPLTTRERVEKQEKKSSYAARLTISER